MSCVDCGQGWCGYEAMRQRGEIVNLRLSRSVVPCFDLNGIAYMFKPEDWTAAEAEHFIKVLRMQGHEVNDTELFFRDVHAAIVAFDAEMSELLGTTTIKGDADMTCDYCKEELTGVGILVNGQAAHEACAVKAGDVEPAELTMEAPEKTWEEKQNWAADIQTAQALMVERDYLGVIKHVGGMYGLSEDEALSIPEGVSLKEQADRVMGVIHA